LPAPDIASAIVELARDRMLASLMDARTATELAAIAGVTPSTASVHLQRLPSAQLVKVLAQGKCRYYSLHNHAPEDPFFAIPASQIETALATHQPLDYGWPSCYFENGTVHPDPSSENHRTRTATWFPPPTPPSPRTAHHSALRSSRPPTRY
jgi:DNA-binding transcriptional ArsR family regulator